MLQNKVFLLADLNSKNLAGVLDFDMFMEKIL